jgi:hypothetical protein
LKYSFEAENNDIFKSTDRERGGERGWKEM